MDLEHLVKLPQKQFYQWENGGQLHQVEYETFQIPGTNNVISKRIPCSEIILPQNGAIIRQGYTNSFIEY